MRPGQQNKRGRGRNSNSGGSNSGRKGGNSLSRTYDSSGPDVKIRGTAQHVAEKYAALARDAQSSGDIVMAENYLQHAEHYNRIIALVQAQIAERQERDSQERDAGERDRDRNEADAQAGDDQEQNARPAGQNQPGGGAARRGQHDSRDGSQEQPELQGGENQPVMEPFIDAGAAPQPQIEGVPAEVALEAENTTGSTKTRRSVSRRRGPGRPKRQPRKPVDDGVLAETPSATDGQEHGAVTVSSDTPVKKSAAVKAEAGDSATTREHGGALGDDKARIAAAPSD